MTLTLEEKKARHKKYNEKYRAKHKERLDKERKEWLAANPEARRATTKRYREKTKPSQLKRRAEYYEWYMWNSIRTRAKRYGHDFNLEVSDIVIPEMCPYLQQPLTRLVGQGRQDFNPSVDRIDPQKGYIKGNIEIMSDKANRMKNNASVKELLLFAEEVIKRYRDL